MIESFQEGRDDNTEEDKQVRLRCKEAISYYKGHKLQRAIFRALLKLESYRGLLPPPLGERDPEVRRFMLEREARTGLLEGSILANELYFPREDGTSIEHRVAVAGRWVAYDFNRPKEFGRKGQGKQFRQGKLIAFPLEDIIHKDKEDYTPTNKLNIIDPLHFFQFEAPSIEELLKYGLAEEATYQQAYEEAGLWEQTKDFFMSAGLADRPVLKITPKGNGLVLIVDDTGETKPEPKGLRQFKPAFGFQYA